MYLRLQGKEVLAIPEAESTFRSRHTGSDLRRIRVSITARSTQEHKSLLLELKRGEADSISSYDENGEFSGWWLVHDSSFAYVRDGDFPHYHHRVYLDEVEELELERLDIEDLSLHPYFYEEEFDCDDLSIKARVLISPSEDARLRSLIRSGDFFSVVRHGIDEQPREMRFGKTILWSRHNDGFKYEIIMVDRSYDERDRPLARIFQPQTSRMQFMLAANMELLDGLIQALLEKGTLSPEEASSIRKRAEESSWDRMREFFEVKDVDEFLNPQLRITWD
ncbi:MAG: hypothetical protein A4E45_00484 [Methanosaeta sp. PtaB.Bin039]|nr:MAG: hypothetical protein A4E45_00484 [Methanosaeta sp. PtaB.Bin039]OPY46150.1 MAG: hypothetical protein A4E47_00710 [Methanosaeta sp. PtaU1.Bin028]HOT07199.1 hypothetical protein [Methanotrichaceae archaeon]HQF17196.1 hypothetical protein [Methanotrichaceae archaeon]HQI91769.1 hypothetical protein [Methanotrichaceae archaeon]